MKLLSPVEEAYLSGTREFTKSQQRYIRYRLRKKLKLIDESRDAAAARLLRLEGGSSLVGRGVAASNNNNYNERWRGEWDFRSIPRVSNPRVLLGHGISNPTLHQKSTNNLHYINYDSILSHNKVQMRLGIRFYKYSRKSGCLLSLWLLSNSLF